MQKKSLFKNKYMLQFFYLFILVLILIFFSMVLEIKKDYDKEEILEQQRLDLLNLTKESPVVLDETSSKEVSCKGSWFCTDWADCRNNVQKRACLDQNTCKTTINKPATEQSC